MIELRPEWANGLDGERYVPGFVTEATEALSNAPGSLRTGGAARGIDYALAAACLDADTDEEAYNHICFIVAELEKARQNMRVTLAGAPSAPEESFERDGYLYVPEERENVGDSPGWIWTRWARQQGGGQALDGRAFLASGTSQHGVVARFEALDRYEEGDDE